MGGHPSGSTLWLRPLLSLFFPTIQLLPFTRLCLSTFLPAPVTQQTFLLGRQRVPLSFPFPVWVPQLLFTIPQALSLQLTRQTPVLLVSYRSLPQTPPSPFFVLSLGCSTSKLCSLNRTHSKQETTSQKCLHHLVCPFLKQHGHALQLSLSACDFDS